LWLELFFPGLQLDGRLYPGFDETLYQSLFGVA
jgi:hypothetical protein